MLLKMRRVPQEAFLSTARMFRTIGGPLRYRMPDTEASCGRSAHTEAGWFAGRGLKTIVYMPGKQEPELMYKLFDRVVGNLDELVDALC